jgi:hypothetical protein
MLPAGSIPCQCSRQCRHHAEIISNLLTQKILGLLILVPIFFVFGIRTGLRIPGPLGCFGLRCFGITFLRCGDGAAQIRKRISRSQRFLRGFGCLASGRDFVPPAIMPIWLLGVFWVL